MLRIIGSQMHNDERIKFDPYVPFTIEFFEKFIDPPFYWRSTDGSKFLFEIGINRKTGIIQSMTLTLVQNEMVREAAENDEPITTYKKQGLPICSIDAWSLTNANDFEKNYKDNFLDECKKFELLIGKNWLCLQFEDNIPITSFMCINRVFWGVNEAGALSKIKILNISNNEMLCLKEAIGGRSFEK